MNFDFGYFDAKAGVKEFALRKLKLLFFHYIIINIQLSIIFLQNLGCIQ